MLPNNILYGIGSFRKQRFCECQRVKARCAILIQYSPTCVITSGNVVMKFSSRLQIDPMLFGIGRRDRTSKPTFPGAQSADVNNRKGDDYNDHPKYDFH